MMKEKQMALGSMSASSVTQLLGFLFHPYPILKSITAYLKFLKEGLNGVS